MAHPRHTDERGAPAWGASEPGTTDARGRPEHQTEVDDADPVTCACWLGCAKGGAMPPGPGPTLPPQAESCMTSAAAGRCAGGTSRLHSLVAVCESPPGRARMPGSIHSPSDGTRSTFGGFLPGVPTSTRGRTDAPRALPRTGCQRRCTVRPASEATLPAPCPGLETRCCGSPVPAR
jgi:hypothetical protein